MLNERVKQYFQKFGIEHRIILSVASTATVEQAAQALGTEPGRIAKTLSFKVKDGTILVVAAGDVKVDNKKYRDFFGEKARMVSSDETLYRTGHTVGGVCPFAVNEGVPIYLDISLKRFDTVFPAAGSSTSCIELTLDELQTYSLTDQWVDVCKDWK
jgi:prolyl-tRNA editing enzyme YbaK/EbsC (Cys-tRNA(Pro) deacylase)